MPQLLKTTETGRGKKAHYHIAYIQDNGMGITSIDQDHTHNIVTIEQIIDGQEQPVVITYLTEVGKHTHSLLEYPAIPEQKTQEDEKDIVNSVFDGWTQALNLEKESITSGHEAENLVAHRQWIDSDVKKLESEDRAVIQVNKLEKSVDNLSGYQRQNRTDIKYLPMEGGDQRVADILNYVSKYELDACNYSREESKVFEDSMISGRGLFHDYIDHNEDFRGRIIVEKFKWDEVNFAEHEKEDLSDCDELYKHQWFSESKIKEMYPDKAERFYPENRATLSAAGKGEDWSKRIKTSEYVDLVAKRFKIIEREKKVYRKTFILVNSNDGFTFNADGWKIVDINSIKTIPGFYKIPRIAYTIRVTKVCSNILLEDYFKKEDENDFSITPLYAKFRNNEFWGKIEGVKDLQKLINRAYSQFVDIINKVVNYGWFYDAETFPDNKSKQAWKKNAAKPGFNQEVNAIDKPPVKVEGLKFPAELIQAIAQFNNDLREVMNINLEMLGINDQSQSGIAIKQKIAQQLVGNDFLFDNLSFVKKILGRKIIKKFKKLYTPERILRLLINQNLKEPVEIAGRKMIMPEEMQNREMMMKQQSMSQEQGQGQPAQGEMKQSEPEQQDPVYTIEELQTILETAGLENYDVVVSESPSSPSAMMSNFLMMMELAGKGLDIPVEAIMEFATIPNKEKVMSLIAQSQKQRAAMERLKYDTEMNKTIINARAKTGSGVMQ